MTAHIHAALMMEYAKDAAESETPWENWEFRNAHFPKWESVDFHPSWEPDTQYRRKPKTIRIGDMEVLKPMKTDLYNGQEYWFVDLDCMHGYARQSKWDGDTTDHARLRNGICHTTKEAAEAHAKALIKVSGGSV